jgi:hypothetical protein
MESGAFFSLPQGGGSSSLPPPLWGRAGVGGGRPVSLGRSGEPSQTRSAARLATPTLRGTRYHPCPPHKGGGKRHAVGSLLRAGHCSKRRLYSLIHRRKLGARRAGRQRSRAGSDPPRREGKRRKRLDLHRNFLHGSRCGRGLCDRGRQGVGSRDRSRNHADRVTARGSGVDPALAPDPPAQRVSGRALAARRAAENHMATIGKLLGVGGTVAARAEETAGLAPRRAEQNQR